MNTQTLRKKEREKERQSNTTQHKTWDNFFQRKGCTQVGLEPMPHAFYTCAPPTELLRQLSWLGSKSPTCTSIGIIYYACKCIILLCVFIGYLWHRNTECQTEVEQPPATAGDGLSVRIQQRLENTMALFNTTDTSRSSSQWKVDKNTQFFYRKSTLMSIE